jgi:hypothetical protein
MKVTVFCGDERPAKRSRGDPVRKKTGASLRDSPREELSLTPYHFNCNPIRISRGCKTLDGCMNDEVP